MKLFEVETSRPDGGGVTLSLSGELDLATVDDLQSALDDGTNGAELVVVDLRKLTFLDSSGLRLMLRLDARVRGECGRLVIVQGPRPVHRVFELTLATEELEIVADPADIRVGPDVSEAS